MSKSPKTGRQGDERNLYLRRLKATNGPHKHADTNDRLNVKQSDTTRPNIVGTSQRSNVPLIKTYKNKLSPIKNKSLKSSQVTNHLFLQSLKEKKRLQSSSIQHLRTTRTMKVANQEGGDSVSNSKGLKKEIPKGKNKPDENVDKEKEKKVENNQADGPPASTNANGKATETASEQEQSENNTVKENKDNGDKILEVQENQDSKHDDEDKKVSDDDQKTANGKEEVTKVDEKSSTPAPIDDNKLKTDVEIVEVNEKIESERQSTPLPTPKENLSEKKSEESLSGSDVVESTTSEAPAGQNDAQKSSQTSTQSKDDDVPFVSYDSNIMLKDVQIKLNDCLKDNSKMFDVTDPNMSLSESFKDQSFGRTLRSISGRSSLGRLRNITVRERIMSPNDSLFVNTSRISVSQERAAYTELADSSFHDYSHSDRKRKREHENESTTKKAKHEEGYNFLNFSWDYLKHWRRPDQASTPSPKEYNNLNLDDKSQINADNDGDIAEPKKWCNVM